MHNSPGFALTPTEMRAQAHREPTCSVYHTKCEKGREKQEWTHAALLRRNVLEQQFILPRWTLNASPEEARNTGTLDRAIARNAESSMETTLPTNVPSLQVHSTMNKCVGHTSSDESSDGEPPKSHACATAPLVAKRAQNRFEVTRCACRACVSGARPSGDRRSSPLLNAH
jgi:hypothetical protein